MKAIFLDGASTTPLDKNVLKAMKPFLHHSYKGNSASVHEYGIRASQAIENARSIIASITRAKPEEVYFTSGATESNNWVILSTALNELMKDNPKKHIVCSAVEHSSVLKTCESLIPLGFEISFVKPDIRGIITGQAVKKALRPDTLLVCVMAVNNETGVLNEAEKAAAFARRNKSLSLIDCTQLMGYGDGDTRLCSLYPHGDYFSFSAHKFYGPTGVGCLIARSDVPLYPLLHGGSQEFGKRGGTSNVAGIVGMGKALELIYNNKTLPKYYYTLYSYLLTRLEEFGDTIKLNAYPYHKNIISLNCSGIIQTDNLANLLVLENMAVSAGSACDSEHDDIIGFNPSHVLTAMGLSETDIRNTVRISFTKETSITDIDKFITALKTVINEHKESKYENN